MAALSIFTGCKPLQERVRRVVFVFLFALVEALELFHPITEGGHADKHKNPIHRVGQPPVVHKTQHVIGNEQSVNK